MKHVLLVLSFFILYTTQAQQKADTTTITQAARLSDLSFTAAEKDSMVDGLNDNLQHYRKMHELSIPNSLPYPFAFNPAPHGYTVPVKQAAVAFNIPANINLPANRNELAFYSLLQLASLIKYKKISSVELTTFFLDRLKKWGDTLECVITLTPELALEQARQADEAIKKGLYKGPLHGIPYGLKDLFAVKGYKTTWGSVPYKDQVIDEDAFVYTQLKKAGAVLCAKLTLGELAYADLWFGGRTRNPWNGKLGSSGSSAGSASATVAGLLPFAIGTETWGSIVSPSHTCGATGLRPTFGSVSRSGAMVLCWSLDKAGPICRSAEDAAIVFYHLKGTDGKDAGAITRAFNYTGKADLKKLRIACAANYFKNLSPTAPQWAVLETLRKAGADIREVNFPDSTIYPFNIMDIVLSAESAAAFDELTRSNQDDLIRRQDKNFWPNSFRVSRFVPAAEYINANRHRYALMEKLNAFIKLYDVIIVPTFSGNQLAMTNLTGHPVVVFPVGFSQNGLPTSITLLGNLYDEATILAVAKAYQDATDFHTKHPEKFKQ
ncbi:amidase [Pseudoflavitalea sp. X16]|uniref:amidase n=1 Tax=Paraflavitalea devenefica TaxID=2716334 RepID=UPI00141E270A|nr:amidase [Paraflavitalea devenefica]NII25760.1 amidase [Paraflavitalea devenefica]